MIILNIGDDESVFVSWYYSIVMYFMLCVSYNFVVTGKGRSEIFCLSFFLSLFFMIFVFFAFLSSFVLHIVTLLLL